MRNRNQRSLQSLRADPRIKEVISKPIITNADEPKRDGSGEGNRVGLKEISEEVEFYNQLVDASEFDNDLKINIADIKENAADYESIINQLEISIEDLENGRKPAGINFDTDGVLNMSDEDFLELEE